MRVTTWPACAVVVPLMTGRVVTALEVNAPRSAALNSPVRWVASIASPATLVMVMTGAVVSTSSAWLAWAEGVPAAFDTSALRAYEPSAGRSAAGMFRL